MFEKRILIFTIGKYILRAIGAVSIAVLIVFFLSTHISRIGDALSEKRKLAFLIESRQEVASLLRETFNQIGDSDSKIERALPPADNILEFVGALESLANQYGLVQTFQFSTPVSMPQNGQRPISSTDYTLQLNGNIFTLLSYLKDFEALPYFSGISSISLTAPADRGWEGQSLITIKAQLYVQ